MTLSECITRIHGSWAVPGDGDIEFFDVVVSDLMSDVLVAEPEDFILVTSLTSEQVLRTADIVDARAILITNGKQPQKAMETLARQQGMPVLTTPMTTFDACRALAACKS